jgi:hypothetical protein
MVAEGTTEAPRLISVTSALKAQISHQMPMHSVSQLV